MKELHLTLDSSILAKYQACYFKKYPRRKKFPIVRPIHNSLNEWAIATSMKRNTLKQAWKEMIVWWIEYEHLSGLGLEEFELDMRVFMPSRRRADPDNYTPKFILDGFVEAGLLVDDDGTHLKRLSISTDYDKDNPRTEFKFTIYKEKEHEQK